MQKVDQATKNEVKQSKLDQFFCAEERQEWTVSTATATVQHIMTKYCKNTVRFLFTILCTVLTTRIIYCTLILICVLVNPLR